MTSETTWPDQSGSGHDAVRAPLKGGAVWPPKGSPEYDERIARMRAGYAAYVARGGKAKVKGKRGRPKGSTSKPKPAPARAVGEAELIDTGQPSPVSMFGSASRPSAGPADDELEIRRHLLLGCEMLARIPGHEHWHREEDEIALVSEPAARIYGRLDAGLRDKIRQMSDPVALIVASVCVFGPSIMMEVRGVRTRPSSARGRSQPQQQRHEQYQEPTGDWPGGDVAPHSSSVAPNGAEPTPYPPGIPTQGI